MHNPLDFGLLFILKGANFTLTTDQAFTRVGTFSNYRVSYVNAVMQTGGINSFCSGGIYTAASKGGFQIIASSQSWSTLTAAGKMLLPTLAAINNTQMMSEDLYFSLTSATVQPAVGDIYVYGAAFASPINGYAIQPAVGSLSVTGNLATRTP